MLSLKIEKSRNCSMKMYKSYKIFVRNIVRTTLMSLNI